MVSVSNADLVNKSYALMASKDSELNELLDRIDAATEQLSSEEVSNTKKYEIVVGVEYLLTRVRFVVETEHIKVKQILAHPDVSVPLKAVFTKRDQYLAQVCLKISSIRDDIATLQKVVYTASNFIRK